MKPFFCTVAVLFFSSISVWAQTSVTKTIKGKVVSAAVDLEGIYIVNLNTEVATASANGGYFEIQAKSGDTLMFSAIQIKGKKVVLEQNDFKDALFFVRLEGVINSIEEVKIIKYNNINAVSLGILQKPAVVYTPAERKLRSAGDFHWYSPLLIPLGGMSVDGLLNSINGRKAMLQKELVVERKEIMLEKIDNLFETNFFINKLKIPSEYVKGFKYYVVDNQELVNAVNSKNKTMVTFVLGDLAVDYLKLNGIEK